MLDRIKLYTTAFCLVLLAGSAASFDNEQVVHGEALVLDNGTGRLYVAVDRTRPALAWDGIADDIFVFEGEIREAFERRLRGTVLTFADGALIIDSVGDKFAVEARVTGDFRHEPQGELLKFRGPALVHYRNPGLSMKDVTTARLDRMLAAPVAQDLLACRAGGAGMDTCGLSGCADPPRGCAVFCADGYFACGRCSPGSDREPAACVCVQPVH